ncbi:MAG: hypothetical protein EOO03_03920, partial [Chitinophagaceae bacterium]
MFRKVILPPFFRKNIYLLVVAAWLVTLSFLINNYWSSFSSLRTVHKEMNNYVQKGEKDFNKLLQDPALKPLYQGKPIGSTWNLLAERSYFVFFY